MFYVPLYIEALRSRPALLFWTATLAQAALWVAVPMVFYAAPPGNLPQLLAIGHQFPLRGDVGPPLAYWLAEIAFRLGGLFAVYALSQICVAVTYWCVFALGSAMVGPSHAALAVLLMAGISLFTVPSPEFGPSLLAMALWGRRWSWYGLGVAAALLLLTTDAALLLLGLLVAFTALTARGRAALGAIEPWLVGVALAAFLFAHLLWLQAAGDGLAPVWTRLRDAELAGGNTVAWLRLLAVLVLAHAGAAILVVLANGWPRSAVNPAPALARPPVDPAAVSYVKTFALAPALLATIAAVLAGASLPIGGAAPLVVLSGLAVIVAAGDSIALFHQRILGLAWAGLLIVPALFVPAVVLLLPWTTGTELEVSQPANAMGRFFADSFARRTGQPLAIVTGDSRTAALVALAAPSRPAVYFEADPERSPWVTPQDIRQKGAVVVWPAAGAASTPPPDIQARFPDLVAEVPQTFDRPVRGRLPALRVGWGVIRPGSVAAAH
jgi:hypothetical protein